MFARWRAHDLLPAAAWPPIPARLMGAIRLAGAERAGHSRTPSGRFLLAELAGPNDQCVRALSSRFALHLAPLCFWRSRARQRPPIQPGATPTGARL